MATVNIPAPKSLNINDKSASSLWKSCKKTWERFEIATGIDKAGDKKRVCTLLSIIGEDAVKVFDTFEYGDGETEDSIHDVLNKFEEYCNPRRNTIYERYKFQCRHQEAGESGSCYLTELRVAADSCDFATITASEILRDQFVHGLRDAKMRERLLRETNLTLDRAYAMVQAAEATTEQMHVMSGEQAVSAVHQRGNRGQQGQQGRKSRDTVKNPSYFKCKKGCIRRAKDTVYWPLMNQQITDYVSQCSVCNTYRREQC